MVIDFIEAEWLASPEFDPQHLRLALDCLRELRERLHRRGSRNSGLPLSPRPRGPSKNEVLADTQGELF